MVHEVCMDLGLTLAEYERRVGPRNQYYHERATAIRLYREGILPLDDDEHDGQPELKDGSFEGDSGPETHGRGL